MTKYIEDKKAIANNLLRLVKDHKVKCNGSCSISLYMVGRAYSLILNRKLTEEEFKIFM